MRNTWAAYLVDIGTGKIEWTLGGRHSSFKFGARRRFRVAARRGAAPERLDGHDVRRSLLPDHRRRHIRVHQRTVQGPRAQARPAHADGDPRRPVHPRQRIRRGLHGQLPVASATATCSSAGGRNPTSPSTADRASCSLKVSSPDRTSPTGRRWSSGSACRSRRPRAPLAKRMARRRCTQAGTAPPQVASWRILGGPDASRPAVVTTVAKSGFETAIPVRPSYESFKVEALNAKGRAIGASAPFTSRVIR